MNASVGVEFQEPIANRPLVANLPHIAASRKWAESFEPGRGRHRVGQPLGLRRPPRPACSQPSQIPARGQAGLRGRPQTQGAAPQIVAARKELKISSTWNGY